MLTKFFEFIEKFFQRIFAAKDLMKMLLEQIQIPIGLLKNFHFRSLMIDVILQGRDVPKNGSH